MRDLSLLMVFVLAGASTSAQENPVQPSQRVVTRAVSEGCPVNFGAQVNARAIVHSVQDAKEKDAQLLELRFERLRASGSEATGAEARTILRASVTVHGVDQGARVLPVRNARDEDRTQVFELERRTEPAGLVDRDVWVHKMLVKWAEVTELRFADGSVWRASKDSYCRATPSLFRLVAATAR
jgi:hypothetical protein